ADGAVISRAGNVTLTADAIATDGAITSVAFYDGATLLGTDTSLPYSITPPLSGGPHYLKAIATDANGLSRTSFVNRVDVAYPPTANAASLSTPQAAPIDIDLHTLISDVETPLTSLKLALGSASNGTVVMLPDGHTARFTPAAGYSGPASFSYTVTDTTRDERTVLNYAFQSSDVTDSSGQGRDGTLNVQGTGTSSFASDSPLSSYVTSLALTENSTAGAVRLERMLNTSELDLATADWTLAGWFKRSTATNQDVIMQLGSSGSFGPSALTLAFYGTGSTLELRNFTSANTQDIGLSKTNVATGTWNHFAVVRSGSVISWYHNGVLVGSDNAFALAITNSQPVKFGGSGATTVLDRWLNGSLADLAVFDAALAPADITKLTTTPVQWLGGQNAGATISIQVGTPIEAWRYSQFGTTSTVGIYADTADKDNDGLANLLEYACATNPNTSTPPPQSATRNGANFDFIYTKNKSATDVTYTVEWSDTLGNDWSASGIGAPSVLSDNGSTQQIKVTVPAGSGVSKRFVHLKVTRP
ncbi:MAG: cadherin-like domain-containing protein, partial [Verrucomicrobiaceae bacterium]|nr:cadherin-like domain-containing protein [Verrucomicrobiaceae bacterium]